MKFKQIVNLTPHDIVANGVKIQASGLSARLKLKSKYRGTHFGIPIKSIQVQGVENLPSPKRGVYLIVSQSVKVYLLERRDLLTPYELLTNSVGKVVGCKSLSL